MGEPCSHEGSEMNDRNLKPSVKDCIDDLIETCNFPELYRTYAEAGSLAGRIP